MALCLGAMGSGCGSSDTKTDASASSSATPKSGGTAAAAKSGDAKKDDKDAKKDDAKKDDKDAKKDDGDKKDVDVDALLDEGDKTDEKDGALNVDLAMKDADSANAPSLGGSAPPPAPKDAGAKLDWIKAGSFMIPNAGMKKEEAGELLILELPDKKGGVIFTPFKDAAEAKTKVEKITEAMKLKDFKWKQKMKPVTLGPDKIPAVLGGGHAVGADGKGGKLAYALIKGTPNVLAIVGVDDDAPKSDMDLAFSAIAFIKK